MRADLVINFSGGKDSTVMLDKVVRTYGATRRIHVIFADTHWEHVETDEWEGARDWCKRVVDLYGLPLAVVENKRRTLLEEVRERGKFPSARERWCTAHHKRNPIQSWVRNNVTNPLICQTLGIRAAESPSRAKKQPFGLDQTLTTRSRRVYTWYPIFYMATDAVYKYIDDHHLPLHPVYSFLPRFSCRVCIFHSPADLAAVRKHDPDSFEIWAKLEEEIQFTANPKGSARTLADQWEAKHNAQLSLFSPPCLE